MKRSRSTTQKRALLTNSITFSFILRSFFCYENIKAMAVACWRIRELFLQLHTKNVNRFFLVVAGFRRHISSFVLCGSVMNLLKSLLFWRFPRSYRRLVFASRNKNKLEIHSTNRSPRAVETSSHTGRKKRNRQRATDFSCLHLASNLKKLTKAPRNPNRRSSAPSLPKKRRKKNARC